MGCRLEMRLETSWMGCCLARSMVMLLVRMWAPSLENWSKEMRLGWWWAAWWGWWWAVWLGSRWGLRLGSGSDSPLGWWWGSPTDDP